MQVPHTLAGTSWEAEEEGYVRHLLSICDRFAPGTSDLVRIGISPSAPSVKCGAAQSSRLPVPETCASCKLVSFLKCMVAHAILQYTRCTCLFMPSVPRSMHRFACSCH